MLAPAALAFMMGRMQHMRGAHVLHPPHRLLRGKAAQGVVEAWW